MLLVREGDEVLDDHVLRRHGTAEELRVLVVPEARVDELDLHAPVVRLADHLLADGPDDPLVAVLRVVDRAVLLVGDGEQRERRQVGLGEMLGDPGVHLPVGHEAEDLVPGQRTRGRDGRRDRRVRVGDGGDPAVSSSAWSDCRTRRGGGRGSPRGFAVAPGKGRRSTGNRQTCRAARRSAIASAATRHPMTRRTPANRSATGDEEEDVGGRTTRRRLDRRGGSTTRFAPVDENSSETDRPQARGPRPGRRPADASDESGRPC